MIKRVKFKKKKNKGKFSKGVIVFILLFLFCFTVSNMILFYFTSNEPSTLITCVFGFCGAEGGYLAFIKKVNNEKEKSEDDVYE